MTGTSTIQQPSSFHGFHHHGSNNLHATTHPAVQPGAGALAANMLLPGLKHCTPQALGAAALLGAMMYMDNKGIGGDYRRRSSSIRPPTTHTSTGNTSLLGSTSELASSDDDDDFLEDDDVISIPSLEDDDNNDDDDDNAGALSSFAAPSPSDTTNRSNNNNRTTTPSHPSCVPPPPSSRSPPPTTTTMEMACGGDACHRRSTVVASNIIKMKINNNNNSDACHRRSTVVASNTSQMDDYYNQQRRRTSRVFPVGAISNGLTCLSACASSSSSLSSLIPKVRRRGSAATLYNLQSRERGRPLKEIVRGGGGETSASDAEGVTTAALKVAAMMRGQDEKDEENETFTTPPPTTFYSQPSSQQTQLPPNPQKTPLRADFGKNIATFKVCCKTDSSSDDTTNYRIHCEATWEALRTAIAHRLGGLTTGTGTGTGSNNHHKKSSKSSLSFVVEYVNPDGDTCVLATNEHVREAIEMAADAQRTAVKLTVTVPPSWKEKLAGVWKTKRSWW